MNLNRTMLQNDSPHSITKVQRSTIIIVTLALSMFIFFVYVRHTNQDLYQHAFVIQTNNQHQIHYYENSRVINENCQWYFLNYTPSAWEISWYNDIEILQTKVCETLANGDNVNKSVMLMQRMIELQNSSKNRDEGQYKKHDHLLSKMFYRQRCFDSNSQTYIDVADAAHFIEPLIGLLRDPLTVCSRLSASSVPPSLYDGAILLSKRFLLFSVSAPYELSFFQKNALQTSPKYPIINNTLLPWMYSRAKTDRPDTIVDVASRKVVFLDLGSSYFGDAKTDISETSTRWMYEYYKRFGVNFDRIIAYEAAKLDTTVAWEQLPADVFPIYTLINTGCTANGRLNPWETLQRLVKPQDHVIVKLDIDSFELENLLINQVLNDSKIHSLIDELFFEHHVSVREMLAYWRPPPGSLRDSYVLFTKLRQLGIRMHSWP